MPVKMNIAQVAKLKRNPNVSLDMPRQLQAFFFAMSTIEPNRYPTGAAGTINMVAKAMFRRKSWVRDAEAM